MSTERFKQVLAKYGQSQGINDLTIDEDGYSCLSIKENDQTVIHIKYDTEKNEATLLAEIGKINPNQKHLIYPILLKANDNLQETKGATLAKAAGEDTITIAKKVFADHLNATNFATFMEDFREMTIKWSEQLLQLSRGEMATQANQDEASNIEMPPMMQHSMRA